MRKIQFLIEMKEKEKLEIIDPSEDITISYLNKSDSHLESAKILLKSKKFEETVSMAYYSMYHCLLALLFKYGIKSENHAVSIILLNELFHEKELAEIISFGKSERIDKQYYTDFKISEKDALEMIKKTEDFTIRCRLVIKNTDKDKIIKIRNEFTSSLDNLI